MNQSDQEKSGNSALPVQVHERIAVLDVLRGFALYGVFMVNLSFMMGPSVIGQGSDWLWLEVLSTALVKGLFETKFVALFSLLFGMGLVLQMQRGEAKGIAMTRLYLRRLGLLFGLGLLHGCLLFEGDILFFYSLAGCLLLACHRLPVRRLVLVGASLLVVGVGLSVLWSAFGFVELGEDPASAQAMQQGPLGFTLRQRAINFFSLQVLFSLISFNWRVVAMFFFGAALMKSSALAAEQRALQLRCARLGLGFGLLLESMAVWSSTQGFCLPVGLESLSSVSATLAHELGSLLLALGLASTLVVLVHAGRAKRPAAWLACVGRTALSNYLLQSLLMNLILMWFGLGLWGRLSGVLVMLLVSVLFALQVWLSVWWTARFAYGPVEWVWRLCTYARRPRWRL